MIDMRLTEKYETIKKLDDLIEHVKSDYIYQDKVKGIQNTLLGIGIEANLDVNMYTEIPSQVGKEKLVNKIVTARDIELNELKKTIKSNESIKEDIILVLRDAYKAFTKHMDRLNMNPYDYLNVLQATTSKGTIVYTDNTKVDHVLIRDLSLYDLKDYLDKDPSYIAVDYAEFDRTYNMDYIYEDLRNIVRAVTKEDVYRTLLNIQSVDYTDNEDYDLYMLVQTDDIQTSVQHFFPVFILCGLRDTVVRYGKSGLCGSYLVENHIRLLDEYTKQGRIYLCCRYLDNLRKYLTYIETIGNLFSSL